MLIGDAERRLSERLSADLDAEAERDLLALLAHSRRIAGALEALAGRVTGLCDFEATESAPPKDPRWAEALDQLAQYTNDLLARLEQPPAPLDALDRALLAEAVELVISSQFGSPSMLQRKLRIGYERVCWLLDRMEERGLVGPARGGYARTVLLPAHRVAEAVDAIRR